MSTYLFSDARVGDVVDFCGHQLEVKRSQGHCPLCFFHRRICSGIACLSWEREEGIPAYYKRIPRKKKTCPRPLPKGRGVETQKLKNLKTQKLKNHGTT